MTTSAASRATGAPGGSAPAVGEAPKRQAVRMARHRLRAEDRRTIGPAVEEERIDDALDAEYRAIEAAGGLTFRRAAEALAQLQSILATTGAYGGSDG
jgi:hypothetical protein